VSESRQLPLARFVLSRPPSLRRRATQGLLPLRCLWDVASRVLVYGSLRILIDWIDCSWRCAQYAVMCSVPAVSVSAVNLGEGVFWGAGVRYIIF